MSSNSEFGLSVVPEDQATCGCTAWRNSCLLAPPPIGIDRCGLSRWLFVVEGGFLYRLRRMALPWETSERKKLSACPGLCAGSRWRTDHLLWTPWRAATLNDTEPVVGKLNRSFYGATTGHNRYVAVAFRPFAMVPQSQRLQPQRYLARYQCDSVTILLGNQTPGASGRGGKHSKGSRYLTMP